MPAGELRASASRRGAEALERGVAAGREWTRRATQRTLNWVEGHPGQALLIALAAGLVIGQILFRTARPEREEALE
jgi:ElaB/YqjD/DUF883 family membrane-anchored ribosome-binding protein